MSEARIGETRIEGDARFYWNSKTSGYAKPNDEVSGVYVRIETGEYNKKPTQNYVIQPNAGGEIVLPNHANLNAKMTKVKTGQTVRIVYLGQAEAKRGRNAAALYDVFLVSTEQKTLNQPPMAQSDEMKQLYEQLTFASKVYPDGIPDSIFQEMCHHNPAKVQMLKDEERIFEPKMGFWKVVV